MKQGLIAAMTGVLAACSLPTMDKESDGLARTFYAEVRSGADLTHDAHVDPALASPDAIAALAPVRGWDAGQQPKQVSNTGFSFNSDTASGTTAQLSHAYVYAGGTVHVTTVMRKLPGQTTWTIVGFQANTDTGPAVSVGALPKSNDD
ncbi:MAG TPA: hypothetical protein VGL58_14270 [Caulobacteraceae bacterium]|jgi:hypothetical protein